MGTAIGGVANLLAQLSYGYGKWSSFTFNDITGRCINRETLCALSAAYRAVERNLGLSLATACVESSPVSSYEEGIIGGVMMAIIITASGAAINWFGGSTPITNRIHADVMRGIAGEDTNTVKNTLQKLSEKIDGMVKSGSGSKLSFNDQLFPAVYNIETLKPLPQYLDAVKRSVVIMKECGVPISDNLALD